MMANNNWVVWLTEQGGEIFLGLAPTFSRVGRRRFCVLGEFQSDGPNGVGIWMDVDLVQEFEIPSNTVTDTWQVNPRSCLILWEYIAYIQRGEQLGKIGFTPTSSK
jgi:hypothetical protein